MVSEKQEQQIMSNRTISLDDNMIINKLLSLFETKDDDEVQRQQRNAHELKLNNDEMNHVFSVLDDTKNHTDQVPLSSPSLLSSLLSSSNGITPTQDNNNAYGTNHSNISVMSSSVSKPRVGGKNNNKTSNEVVILANNNINQSIYQTHSNVSITTNSPSKNINNTKNNNDDNDDLFSDDEWESSMQIAQSNIDGNMVGWKGTIKEQQPKSQKRKKSIDSSIQLNKNINQESVGEVDNSSSLSSSLLRSYDDNNNIVMNNITKIDKIALAAKP